MVIRYLLPAWFGYLSNQAHYIPFVINQQDSWRLACLFSLETCSVSFGCSAVVSNTLRPRLCRQVVLGVGHGYRTGLRPPYALHRSTIHLTLGSRVFKNFTALYATNQTVWNQGDFW